IRRSDESISAAEVEMHIGGMPGVEDIAAVPVPDALRGEEIKVIIVPEDGAPVTADQVVAWARGGPAACKVPRYVESREELPYTASGKVHKAALKNEPDPLHDRVIDTRA